jgi:hypothetical protein
LLSVYNSDIVTYNADIKLLFDIKQSLCQLS